MIKVYFKFTNLMLYFVSENKLVDEKNVGKRKRYKSRVVKINKNSVKLLRLLSPKNSFFDTPKFK